MTTTMSAQQVTTPDDGASIRVRDLWKVYGPGARRHIDAIRSGADGEHPGCTTAVRGVSFDVKPGETFVVMGLSGSGKSTLVRCLTRLVEPTDGAVDVDGVNVLKMNRRQLSETRRNDWAMVFQHFGLLPHRRVLQNVAYGLEVSGVGRRERDARAREMIELVGLRGVEDKFPHELSGGMKQRVGLARALAVDPKLLLLDEPFSALDPLIRADLQDQLLRLAKVVKQTAVFITHDLAEALKVGDRIAIMRDGQFVQVGTPEEIVLHPKDDYVRRFALEAPRAKVVTAGTAANPAAVLTGTETVHAALAAMSANGVTTAIVDGRLPFAVTEDQLRFAESGQGVRDVAAGDFAVVGDGAKLEVVMSELIRTSNPVIVRNAAHEFVGTVDNASVVRALSARQTVPELGTPTQIASAQV
jgi:glycine betaine/proline transport system ATP-binding protein